MPVPVILTVDVPGATLRELEVSPVNPSGLQSPEIFQVEEFILRVWLPALSATIETGVEAKVIAPEPELKVTKPLAQSLPKYMSPGVVL